jgi:transcriptional regulator with XRE-family HTH domain
MMNQTFSNWVLEQLEDREWTRAELSRRAGLSRTAISDVILGKANPGFHLCVSIGNALEIPPEGIFRKAGLLPENPDIDEEIELILHEVAKLPKGDQEEVLAFIRMKRKLREKGSK